MKRQKSKPKNVKNKFLFRKVNRQEIESFVVRYLNEPSVQNTLELTQIIHENTAHKILARLPDRKDLIKHGREVFGNDKVFLDYLFETPWAFRGKMPIEFLTDTEGVKIVVDELVRIEHGILS